MLTGNGSNLSQGQRSAAVDCPLRPWPIRPAMILDEATSSIDTRTEAHRPARAWTTLMDRAHRRS